MKTIKSSLELFSQRFKVYVVLFLSQLIYNSGFSNENTEWKEEIKVFQNSKYIKFEGQKMEITEIETYPKSKAFNTFLISKSTYREFFQEDDWPKRRLRIKSKQFKNSGIVESVSIEWVKCQIVCVLFTRCQVPSPVVEEKYYYFDFKKQKEIKAGELFSDSLVTINKLKDYAKQQWKDYENVNLDSVFSEKLVILQGNVFLSWTEGSNEIVLIKLIPFYFYRRERKPGFDLDVHISNPLDLENIGLVRICNQKNNENR